jgi:hypothetical protein
VKSDEPWARGKYAVSIEIGRISSALRPSTRSPRSTIRRRTSAFSTISNASRTAAFAVSSTASALATSSNTRLTASARSCFSWIANAATSF